MRGGDNIKLNASEKLPNMWLFMELVAAVHKPLAKYRDSQRKWLAAGVASEEAAGPETARQDNDQDDGSDGPNKKKARKKRAREEAARQRTRRRLVLGGAAAGVCLLVCVLVLVFRNPAAPGKGAPENNKGVLENIGGFVVLDALDEDVPLTPGVANNGDRRRLVESLANAAPPFDPKKPPTMRSTLGHLLTQEHMAEQVVDEAEARLKGDPNKEVDASASERLQRPAAPVGDRAGVVAQRPQPPQAWTAPSFVSAPVPPAEPQGPETQAQFAVWPTSFGDAKAALVRYAPHPSRERWEVWLDLLDCTTGRRAAPAAKLWDAALPPEPNLPQGIQRAQQSPRPLPALGALRHDASIFALVDPCDPRRVDFFKPDGSRLSGLLVHAERRIDWLGWSTTHLLTVAAGRLTAWDPATGKARYETDGGYTYVGAIAPDRKWVVLWTGTHGDILDTATGRCLGRCQAGGFSGRLKAFTLAPDGRRLAAAFTGWPHDIRVYEATPGFTAVVWNLETGKTGLFGFRAFNDGEAPVPGGKEFRSTRGYRQSAPLTCRVGRQRAPAHRRQSTYRAGAGWRAQVPLQWHKHVLGDAARPPFRQGGRHLRAGAGAMGNRCLT